MIKVEQSALEYINNKKDKLHLKVGVNSKTSDFLKYLFKGISNQTTVSASVSNGSVTFMLDDKELKPKEEVHLISNGEPTEYLHCVKQLMNTVSRKKFTIEGRTEVVAKFGDIKVRDGEKYLTIIIRDNSGQSDEYTLYRDITLVTLSIDSPWESLTDLQKYFIALLSIRKKAWSSGSPDTMELISIMSKYSDNALSSELYLNYSMVKKLKEDLWIKGRLVAI